MRDDTKAAAEQYNYMARMIEQIKRLADGKSNSKYEEGAQSHLDIFRSAAVYLWSDEKSEKCLQYVQTHEINVADLFKVGLPAISSDPVSCVMIEEPEMHGEDIFFWYNYSVGDPTLGYLLFYGQVKYQPPFLRRDRTCCLSEVRCVAFDIRMNFCPPAKVPMEDLIKEANNQVNTAVEQLLYTLVPSTFVVREETPHTRKREGRGYPPGVAPRIIDRPIHTVLMPDEVREIQHQRGEAQGTHASPVPHKRRGHSRVLRHERFKQRGKQIFVRDTLINCRPGDIIQVRKRFYHVVKAPTTMEKP
jgi:hypothetical protein